MELVPGCVLVLAFLATGSESTHTQAENMNTLISHQVAANGGSTEDVLLEARSSSDIENNLAAAPLAVTVLGQLAVISAGSPDFSLIPKSGPVPTFKELQFPQSFRACLSQVGNEVHKSLLTAHGNMQFIDFTMRQVPGQMLGIVETLMDGSVKEIENEIPFEIETMRVASNKSQAKVAEVLDQLENVLDTVYELATVSKLAQKTSEDEKQLADREMKVALQREQLYQSELKQLQSEMANTRNEIHEAQVQFETEMRKPKFVPQIIPARYEYEPPPPQNFFKRIGNFFTGKKPRGKMVKVEDAVIVTERTVVYRPQKKKRKGKKKVNHLKIFGALIAKNSVAPLENYFEEGRLSFVLTKNKKHLDLAKDSLAMYKAEALKNIHTTEEIQLLSKVTSHLSSFLDQLTRTAEEENEKENTYVMWLQLQPFQTILGRPVSSTITTSTLATKEVTDSMISLNLALESMQDCEAAHCTGNATERLVNGIVLKTREKLTKLPDKLRDHVRLTLDHLVDFIETAPENRTEELTSQLNNHFELFNTMVKTAAEEVKPGIHSESQRVTNLVKTLSKTCLNPLDPFFDHKDETLNATYLVDNAQVFRDSYKQFQELSLEIKKTLHLVPMEFELDILKALGMYQDLMNEMEEAINTGYSGTRYRTRAKIYTWYTDSQTSFLGLGLVSAAAVGDSSVFKPQFPGAVLEAMIESKQRTEEEEEEEGGEEEDIIPEYRISESFLKLHIAKDRLTELQEQADQLSEDQMEKNRKMFQVIQELRDFNATIMTQKQIIQTISQSIESLHQLRTEWTKLFLYFEEIQNLIEAAMIPTLNNFLNSAENKGNMIIGGDSAARFIKTKMYRGLLKVVITSRVVLHLSQLYLEVSKDHIMPMVSEFGYLLSLNSKDTALLQKGKEKLIAQSEAARESIRERIVLKQEKFRADIEKRKAAIDHAYMSQPPIRKIPRETRIEYIQEAINSVSAQKNKWSSNEEQPKLDYSAFM